MSRYLFTFFFILLIANSSAQHIAKHALPHAHSHNDYQQDKPLWGALAHGCTSIEIDVFAHKKELVVSHVKFALNIKDNFTDMYLTPLVNIIEKQGHIYPETTLILTIDFKTNSDSTLPLLFDAIAPYKEYFSYFHQDSVYAKELQLVITGKGFSYDQVKDQDSIFVFLEGSMKDCGGSFPPKLIPRANAKYGSIFKWKGKGEIPNEELDKLRELVANAKACNKTLRFYAMPESERIWDLFLKENVYWLNLDNIRRFHLYLNANND